MSVKIRLNNKRFLGEGLLIGSRLYEADETVVDASVNANTDNANANTDNVNASTGNTNNQIPPVDQ